jgi:prevent-host-death family protein
MPVRERRVGVRELKSTLSQCLREVKAGRTLVVTEHGNPVARMIPETASVADRLDALRKAGGVTWSGRRLARTKPVARVRGNRTVAELVSENRE